MEIPCPTLRSMRSVRSSPRSRARRGLPSGAIVSTVSAGTTRPPRTSGSSRSTANGVPAEWSTSPTADHARAILFLHGGGYISGSIESHRPLATEIGRAAGARTLALGYRRAPEHPFPAALEDTVSGYRYPAGAGDRAAPHRGRRRQRRRRADHRADGRGARARAAAAGMRLVHLAMGRPCERAAPPWRPRRRSIR